MVLDNFSLTSLFCSCRLDILRENDIFSLSSVLVQELACQSTCQRKNCQGKLRCQGSCRCGWTCHLSCCHLLYNCHFSNYLHFRMFLSAIINSIWQKGFFSIKAFQMIRRKTWYQSWRSVINFLVLLLPSLTKILHKINRILTYLRGLEHYFLTLMQNLNNGDIFGCISWNPDRIKIWKPAKEIHNK